MKHHPALFASVALALAPLLSAADSQHWVASWGASPAPQLESEAKMKDSGLVYENQTLREIVHLSLGGHELRVRLSNAYGKTGVLISDAHVALSAGGSSVAAGSDRALTFGGRAQVTIPADAWVTSDPVALDAPDGAKLAVSLYLPQHTLAAGTHYAAQQNSFRAAGDLTGAPALPADAAKFTSWSFLTGVDVAADDAAGALIAFGDSITDGAKSTNDANHRWPDFLAARLLKRGGTPLSVVDAGIGGNRLLHDPAQRIQFGVNALARFDRDVVTVPGARYVIVLEGINDIGHPGSGAPESEAVSADDLIGAYRQLIARAHEHGLRIYGATITPFAVTTIAKYYSPEKEQTREAVNRWIRTSGEFDGVIDFEKAVEDPANPGHIRAEFDSGDHLHPGDKGYEAMAGAIDLSIFP